MSINYDKLWDTLANRGMTKYTLIKYFDLSPRLISKFQHNEPINTTTIEKLCSILQCKVEDIVTYEEDELNVLYREEGLAKRKKKQYS